MSFISSVNFISSKKHYHKAFVPIVSPYIQRLWGLIPSMSFHRDKKLHYRSADRLLYEDGTSDVIAVFASHGITLAGVGWNAFQLNNDA